MKNKIDKAFKLKKRNLIVTFSNCWIVGQFVKIMASITFCAPTVTNDAVI